MIKQLINTWTYGPKNLEGNDLRDAIYIYRIYLAGFFLGTFNLLIGPISVTDSDLPAFYSVAGTLMAVLIIGGILLSRQAWKAAAVLLITFTWFMITGIALFFRGVQDPVIGLHIPLMVMVGYYFTFKKSLYLLALDLVSLAIISYLHNSGQIETAPPSNYSQFGDLIFWTITFVTSGGILFLSTRRARDNQTDIEAKNKVLAEQRAALETNKANLEKKVTERTRQLEWAKNEAENASQAKSNFLAKMSHELRTPLNIIIGYSELIQETVEDGTDLTNLQVDVGRIQSSGEHLLKVIDSILTFTKIEGGHYAAEITEFYIAEVVNEIEFLAQPLMAVNQNQFKVEWNTSCHPGSLKMTADKQLTNQVFLNLLSNAAKFTKKGKVTFKIDCSAKEGSAPMIKFDIADTGRGIDEAFLPHIFDPFQQEEDTYARVHDGAGLGLAISKEMVERMGGKITAQNNPLGGATFTVYLPAAITEPITA
ncbi:MAG: HAMP domain-containing sensor histidine kinase [Chloroflexota bacterium]